MSDRSKDFLFNLGYGAVIMLLVFFLSYSRRESFVFDNGILEIFLHCLCDGSFVAAVMLLGTGALKAIRNQGVFDVMSFGMKSTVETVFPVFKREEREDLYAYRERKEAARKPARGILLAGAAYLAFSAVVLLWYSFLRW